MSTRSSVQALFLHQRLAVNALDDVEREQLDAKIARQRAATYPGDELAHIVAYQDAVARLLSSATELDIAVIADEVTPGQMVTLTQDFNIRRVSDERGAFRSKLDIDRALTLQGSFSTSWLIGATGRSEVFGRHRFCMLAYVQDSDLLQSRSIALRPLFIGWRLESADAFPEIDDRHQLWPTQCDQFALAKNKRPTDAQRAAVAALSEDAVKRAFAAIIGEPYVPKDWGGETSDLYTSRLTVEGTPFDAAFAFKGPAVKGTLHIANMGRRGDQGLRLFQEPADLLVVQHHDAVSAAVRNLMSALARQHAKRFMIIDGASTAAILAAYGHLPGAATTTRRAMQ